MIVLLGWPSMLYLYHQARAVPLSGGQQTVMAACFVSAAAGSVVIWWWSMRSGVRALERMDRTPA